MQGLHFDLLDRDKDLKEIDYENYRQPCINNEQVYVCL